MASPVELGDLHITINTNAAGQAVSATITTPDGITVVRPFPGNGELTMRLGLGLGIGFRSGAGNQAPTDIAWAGSHSVAEDAALGHQVGGALSFVDPDAGETGTFTLAVDAGGRFAIGADGTSIAVAGVLDFESATSHAITVRFTDAGGLTFDEAFTVTVTNVAEDVPEDPPPTDPPPVVDDPDRYDVLPYTTIVGGSVKFAGKKKNDGLAAKMLMDFGAASPPLALEADQIYTIHWTFDGSLMAQDGTRAAIGLAFKAGNDFWFVGLRGDGGAGSDAVQIYGDNLWNQTSGFTVVDGGDALNGDQYDGWVQIQTSADGTTATVRTSADGNDFDDEFTDADLVVFTDVGDVVQWGVGAIFHADDSGPFVIDVEYWAAEDAVEPLEISGTPVTTGIEYEVAAGGASSSYAGFTVTATGGVPPYAYSVASGSLPAGITLNPSTGVVSGTPALNSEGVYAGIVIRVTDDAENTADLASFSITIAYKDPYFPNTILLTGFDEGVDGGTTTADESPSGRAITFVNQAQLDTAQFKFGPSSALFDGAGDLLRVPDSADWDFAGQFTIECSFRSTDMSSEIRRMLLAKRGEHSSNVSWSLSWYPVAATPGVQFELSTNGFPSTHSVQNLSAGLLAANTWHRTAVDRDGSNKIRVYVDAVMKAFKLAASGTPFSTTVPLTIGATNDGGAPHLGWIDEVRITAGVARYASDSGYTVSNRKFPRS